MNALTISGVGICAPGLPDWGHAASVLSGVEQHRPAPLGKLAAPLLPPTERRRANDMAHLAIHVAAQAVLGRPGEEVGDLRTVFASADGDGRVLAQILEALAKPAIAVSPTLFHNSVFNAPAGYWSIASRCEAPATTLCAGAASFAAGLLEAYTQVCHSHAPVLYVAYDSTFPPALHAFDRGHQPFACALLLGPVGRAARQDFGTIDGWNLSASTNAVATVSSALSGFFSGNAAAAALPLLAAVACRQPAQVRLPYLDDGGLDLMYIP